jgi:hypothetical protein
VQITPTLTAGSAIDQLNAVLADLMPAPPLDLTSLSLQGSFYTARLSAGAANYGTWKPGDLVTVVTNSASAVKATGSFGKADQGILTTSLNSTVLGSANLAMLFDETYRAGQQGPTYANGVGIPYTIPGTASRVLSIAKFAGFAGYQEATLEIGVGTASVLQGANNISATHMTGTPATAGVSFWNDESQSPTTGSVFCLIGTSKLKYTSGIPQLTSGTVVNLGLAACQNVFNSTYYQDGFWLSIIGTAITPLRLLASDPFVNGVTTPVPQVTDTPSLDSYPLTLIKGQTSANGSWSVQTKSPRGDGNTATTALQNVLVNTWDDLSTPVKELFTDENYRIPATDGSVNDLYPATYDTVAAMKVTWDSTAHLSAGEASVVLKSLKFANTDYTNCTPAGPNYSAAPTQQWFARKFYVQATNNLKLRLTTPTLDSATSIQVKLPGVTGWLDARQPYMGGTPSANGDGCLVGQVTESAPGVWDLDLTFGVNSTVASSNGVVLRIGLQQAQAPLDSIELVGAVAGSMN